MNKFNGKKPGWFKTARGFAGVGVMALVMSAGVIMQGIGGIAKPPVEALSHAIDQGANWSQVSQLAQEGGFIVSVD